MRGKKKRGISNLTRNTAAGIRAVLRQLFVLVTVGSVFVLIPLLGNGVPAEDPSVAVPTQIRMSVGGQLAAKKVLLSGQALSMGPGARRSGLRE